MLFPSLSQRFIQYLASRTSLFNLSNFIDKTGSHGKNNNAVSGSANRRQEEINSDTFLTLIDTFVSMLKQIHEKMTLPP